MAETLFHPAEEPVLSRRAALATGALAIAELLSQNSATLLAQEVKRLDANGLLRKLPEKMRLDGGDEATMEKAEVPDAAFLFIAIRSVHKIEREKMTPTIKKVVDASDREVGQIISYLHRNFGITAFAPEGYTNESVRHHKETLERLEMAPKKIALLKKMNRMQEATELEREIRELEAELQGNIPYPSVISLLKQGKMQLVTTETAEALAKFKKLENNMVINQHVKNWIREDASLQQLQREVPLLKQGPGVLSPWGASHWQARKGEKLPLRIEKWNSAHPDAKFSTAVITPPAARDYLLRQPLPDLPDL